MAKKIAELRCRLHGHRDVVGGLSSTGHACGCGIPEGAHRERKRNIRLRRSPECLCSQRSEAAPPSSLPIDCRSRAAWGANPTA